VRFTSTRFEKTRGLESEVVAGIPQAIQNALSLVKKYGGVHKSIVIETAGRNASSARFESPAQAERFLKNLATSGRAATVWLPDGVIPKMPE
jgi:hypothetical protein